MTHFLRILVLVAVLPLAALAQSTVSDFDSEAFENAAVRAEGTLDSRAASTEALEELRQQLVDFRDQAQGQEALTSSKVTPILERLNALGPAPEEGQTEEAGVAHLRAELTTALRRAQGRVVSAEEAFERANGLIRQIDSLIRDRATAALVQQQQSPLAPERLRKGVIALKTYVFNLYEEVEDNLNSPLRKANRISSLLSASVLFCLALLLLVRSRRWSREVEEMLSRSASKRTAALYGFIASLSQLLLPGLGLILLVQALLMLDLFELRGYFLMRHLGIAGFSLYFSSWLARSLFVATPSQPALIDIKPEMHGPMRRSFLALGLMFAFQEMLKAMEVGSGRSPIIVESIPTFIFPLVVIGAFALFRIGRMLSNTAKELGKAESSSPFLSRAWLIMGNICVLAALAGPVLAAIGYETAGNMLVFSTAASLLLISGLYILFRLIGFLSGFSSAEIVAAGAGEDRQRFGALFRVAVGFIIICIAMPLLALIWGARVSDLQDVWLMLRNGIAIGETRVSLTDFLKFVLIFSIGYSITRVLQSALSTTVLPNTRLDVGGQNAIVTGTGYVGIFLAALSAITATGIDLSNLAIVAGALSVGIGFGLQTIVSNFVSGIILLIERPIKAGDWIEVGTYSGYVRKISVRSTEVETFDRASVVIPNADLIAGAVTNWTHSSMSGRVRVPVGVSYDSDPRQVEQILREVAEGHPMVLLEPGPAVIFMGFGADSLDFEIRAILRDVNWMLSAKSDMNFAIFKRFREAGIEIPFAQRDVYIKNLDQLTGTGKLDKNAIDLEPGQVMTPMSTETNGDEEVKA